jgi:hypothetical protein
VLQASTREAVDIPAKIRRSPAKAAAVIGGAGFLALKGPQRAFGAVRRGIFGRGAGLPKTMLPEEVEKTLRKLGPDGDAVRGTIERGFASYLMNEQRTRKAARNQILLSVLAPLAIRASRAGVNALLRVDPESFSRRLAEVRERAAEAAQRPPGDVGMPQTRMSGPPTIDGEPPTGI